MYGMFYCESKMYTVDCSLGERTRRGSWWTGTGSRARTSRSHYLRVGWEQGSDQNVVITFSGLGARLGPQHSYYHRAGWDWAWCHNVITCVLGELGSDPVYCKLIGEHCSDPDVPVKGGSRARPGTCPPTGSDARLISGSLARTLYKEKISDL